MHFGDYSVMKFIITPAVERLPVYLPFMNIVPSKSNAKLKKLIENSDLQKTMLTEWFIANQKSEKAHELTYCEFPLKWAWDKKKSTMEW
jgi:hypothetical protein